MRDQFGSTREAASRLVSAHLELAKAEFADIADEIKRVALLAGLAVSVGLIISVLLPVGLALFLGEWLFGSMGWGILLGTQLGFAVVIAFVLAALGSTTGQIWRPLVPSVVLGIVVGVALGLDLTNEGWRRLGDQLAPNLPSNLLVETRPLVVAVAAVGAVFAVLGLLLGAFRGGIGGAIGGLVGGAILGALTGALTAISLRPEVGAGIGVTVTLTIWPLLAIRGQMQRGIDTEALKAKFWPAQTIETTKETIEWVREQTPLGRKS